MRMPPIRTVAAVDPVAREVDLGFDRRARADVEHPGHRRQGVQVDARADPRAERAGVVDDPWRPGETDGIDLLRHLLGEPQAQMHAAAARIVAWAQAGEKQASGGRRERHPAERRREQRRARR